MKNLDHLPHRASRSKQIFRALPCARVERWVLRLQPYNYTVRHIPGSSNIADSLSRLLSGSEESKEISETEDYLMTIVESATPTASRDDEVFKEIKTCIMSGNWNKLKYKEYLTVKNELCEVGDIILRGTRIVIPEILRTQVIKLGHEGHPGIVVMKQRLRTKVWWPGMDKAIEKSCKTCYGCQLMGKPNRPEPMKRTELPTRPWEQISLPSKDNLLVITDYYSRWVEVVIMKSITAEKTVEALNRTFCMHGYPESITTDNGPQFISQTFKDYMEEHGIYHRKVTPLWPEANGEVERQNRLILKRLRITQAEHKNWKEELQTYLLMYRRTPHCVTGVSPAEMLFRRKLRTKLPELSDHQGSIDSELRDRDKEPKEKGKLYADEKRRAEECQLKEGDLVLLKQNKLCAESESSPYSVVRKSGNSIAIKSKDDVRYKRNVTQMRKFYESDDGINESENENVSFNDQYYNSDQGIEIQSDSINLDINVPNSVSSNTAANTLEVTPTDVSIQTPRAVPPSPRADRPSRERRLPARFKDFVMK